MISTKQLFIHFLKQNNAYEQYIFNFNKREINFINFLNNTGKFDYIYQAFPWHKTKEGTQKWNELSKKWLDKLFQQYCRQKFKSI